jgi:hypothetical protein
MTTFNPEIYLETATRCLKEYAEAGIDAAIQDNNSNDVGLDVYEVVMEFPSDEMIVSKVPGNKSIVHFELDDIQDSILSFGDNVARSVYDPVLHTVTDQEGRRHVLNFDVGIWAWDKSGGTTARLRARQILTNLFTGAQATKNLRASSDGGDGMLEILSYTGGHFTTEYVNDVRVFRMVDTSLSIRVFSRTPNPIISPSIESFDYDLGLILEPDIQL